MVEKTQNTKEKMIIDATNATMGRLASYSAKQLLLGKNLVIINCKHAIITGNKEPAIEKYHSLRQKGGSAQRGPYFPKSPERILKRAIRGMLPRQKGRGTEALKNVICYNECPKEYESAPKIKAGKPKPTKKISLSELSRKI